MVADADPNLVRDAMLTRMAMATPGGPMFPVLKQIDVPKFELTEDSYPKHFDEAQAYSASRKGLVMHSMLMSALAGWAIMIRRELDQGRSVVLSAGGEEIARFDP